MRYLRCVYALILLGGFLQAPVVIGAENVIEEVVVTGSFIRGTPEDAALPVDVLTRDDLEDVGNPSTIEMVRKLGVTSGNLAETNQFQGGGQGNEGVTTANLRGLGSARTLILLNSKRHVATESIGVDISAMPQTAIGRIEVLKDGAAALYGSDAIGGVVNFITRKDYEGLEVRGYHQNIEESDGDNGVSFIWGQRFDNTYFAISAEYDERNELRFRDRDWGLLPESVNPEGGWSTIGNPARYLPAIAPSATAIISAGGPDPQCELLGGAIGSLDPLACRFQYTFFDNLIEETETVKLFSELNMDLDAVALHFEALYHEMDMPAWNSSPSYPPQSLFGPDRYVPATHPGLIDMKAQNPTMFPDVDLTAVGLGVIPSAAQGAFVLNRMLGVAGQNGEPSSGLRNTETQRLSGGVIGDITADISYDVSLSWSQRVRKLTVEDMYIERMGFALDGLGGPNCDQATGTPGTGGCEYYNPFSNAIEVSAVNGNVNPQYNPAVANSQELIDWLTATTGSEATNELLVFDAVFNGLTGFELGGGNLNWAAGIQTRSEDYDLQLFDIANRDLNPCPFTNPASITLGHTATLDCTVESGRLAFLAATDEETTSRTIWGAFLELALPLSDTFDAQIAFRYEDYEDVGSTFDPKLAISWAPTDIFKIRSSASTTFRGPPQSFLEGTNTALAFIPAASAFKAVDINGNPNLEAEKALALNLGVILQTESLYASLDYWSFDFEDPYQTESSTQIVAAYADNQCQDGGAGVGTAACDALRTHIFPLGVPAAGLQRVDTNIINGSDIKTTGFDFVANYTFYDVAAGDIQIGSNGTYVLDFESDPFLDINGFELAPGGDFVGKLNDGDPFTPKPQLQANVFAKWIGQRHRFTYSMRYVDSYEDVRPALPSLATVDSHMTHDIHYVNRMLDSWVLSFSVLNLADEDPPLASTDLNYDPFTHNAFGRMIKLGVVFEPQM